MTTYVISCRAKCSDACYDGTSTRRQFGEDLSMAEDGTFDGETIVCDACYIAIMPYTPSGQALHSEIPAGIIACRLARQGVVKDG